MLYDPKWEVKADWSISGLIGWLETKDPTIGYDFCQPRECLLAQWVASRSLDWYPREITDYVIDGETVKFDWADGSYPHNILQGNGCPSDWTFGAALERARILRDLHWSGLAS